MLIPRAYVSHLLSVLVMAWVTLGSHVLQASQNTGPAVQHEQPKPCCLPYKFQAVVVSLPSFNAQTKLVTRVFRNWDRKIQIQQNVLFNNEGIEQIISTTFMDYENMVKYSYSPGDPCRSTSLDHGMLEPCMPDNATYIGQSYIGAYQDKVNFHAWNFQRSNLNRSIEMTIAVTADRCVPVSERLTGHIGASDIDFLALFTNVTEVIDEKIFDLPRECFSIQPM